MKAKVRGRVKKSCVRCSFVNPKENYDSTSKRKKWECRFNPPCATMYDGTTYEKFPEVDEFQWCHQFK